jgi:hypothetical protein
MRGALLAVAVLAVTPAAARAQGDMCLSATPPPASAPPAPLRFGITPALAGTAGSAQGSALAEDPVQALAALRALQPPGRRLVVRLNRLFESDGQPAIDRFAAQARRYGAAGFDVESQVRYHPGPGQEGDMAAWERFVRAAAAALSRTPALVALDITNEVNLPISSNTSDGAYAGAVQALVRGVAVARAELDARGRPDVSLGFTYAYRYTPQADARFWQDVGAAATPEFRAALGHVGVQLYPGLFWPPVLAPGQSAGDATLEALTLVRDCWMPMAGLGHAVPIWITENGYATNLGHDEARQAGELRATVDSVHALGATLGVTDYRYFNLRDNRPGGTDLFDDVGLLRADYARKLSFGAYRDVVAMDGARPRPMRCRVSVRLPRGHYRRAIVRVDGGRVHARRHGRRIALSVPRGVHAVRVIATRRGGRAVRVRRTARCG